MAYEKTISEIAPDVDAAAVEAFMRLQYGTLDHLSRDDFKQEIRLFRQCQKADPDLIRSLKATY
jgi:hypothetical protein